MLRSSTIYFNGLRYLKQFSFYPQPSDIIEHGRWLSMLIREVGKASENGKDVDQLSENARDEVDSDLYDDIERELKQLGTDFTFVPTGLCVCLHLTIITFIIIFIIIIIISILIIIAIIIIVYSIIIIFILIIITIIIISSIIIIAIIIDISMIFIFVVILSFEKILCDKTP